MGESPATPQFEVVPPEFEVVPPAPAVRPKKSQPTRATGAPALRPEDQAQIDQAIRSVPLSRPDYMQTEHPLTDWFSGNEPTPVSPEAKEDQANLEQFRKEQRAQRQRPSASELATGLASTAAEMFTNPDPLAISTEPGAGAQTRRGIKQLQTPGQRGTGVANLADVGLQALTPLMGPAIAENPVTIAKGFVEGGVASKAAGYASKKAGANPEQQDLAQDLAFWMPGVARSVLDPKANVVSTDQVKGATIGVRGAGAGVAVTPESVNIGGRVGPFRGSVSIPRNGATSAQPALEPPTIEGSQVATDPAARMLADYEIIQHRAGRVAQGLPPAEPPPPPPAAPPQTSEPAAPKVTEISANDIQHIAGIIQKLPPHLRSQGLLEAHQTMSRILEQNGRVIGPNGRLVLIDSHKAAEKIAADWVNDEVSRQDELAAQAVKSQSAGVPSKPEGNSVPRKSRRTQAAEIEQKAFEVAAPELNFEIAPPEKAAVESSNGATVPISVEPHGQERASLSGSGAGNHEQLPSGISGRTQSDNQSERAEEVRPSTTESALPVSGVAEKSGFQKGQQVRFSKDFPVRKGQNQEVAETIPRGTTAFIEHSGSHDSGSGFLRLRLGNGRKLAVNQRAIEAAPSEPAEKPKYASTQINLPEEHAKKVIETGKKLIPDEDLAGKGREGEPHVTLKYGVHENENALRRVLAEHKPFEATLDKIKTFPPTDNSEGTAPVVAEVNAPELNPLHEAIHKAVGAKEDDFDYKPHVTLAYVKPEAAMKYEGSTALEGTRIPVDRISLSRADRTQQAFSLGQKEEVEHAPLRGEVGTMKTSELKLAPNRFQYKLGTDAEGVSSLLKEQDKFNPDLAGVISIWRDPHDGKFYIVNGHHRFELAKRTGQKTIPVRHIAAPDAEQARSIGALQNIAEGRGTPVDAAKFFRDSRVSPEHLKDVGISLGEATARQGVALSRLDTPLFNKVVSGDLRLGRAVAIGEATDDPAEQKAILNLVDKKEARGQKISDGVLSELIRFVKESGREKETTTDLFGSQEITKSLALEKAEISDYIRQQLSKDRKLFGFVSKEGRAEDLARAGNKIEVEKSKEFSTSAQQAEEIYNRLSSRGGEIADILDEAARRLADREDVAGVKSDAYRRIREAVRRALEGAAAERASGREGISGSSREPQKTAPAADHTNHTVEPTLPGMERVPAERAEANAEQQGKELTAKLTEPPKSIESKAGEIEQKSPLFRESAANPQDSLFAEKRTDSAPTAALSDAQPKAREPEVPGPGAKNVSAGKETPGTHLSDLTAAVSKTASTKATVAERMRVGSRIAESASGAKDSLSHAYDRVRGAMAAAWDILRRPPEWDDFTALTGRWSGARQESSWELQKFSDAIKQAIPGKSKREAITNWIEADGDATLLHERAQASKAPYRSGYEAALKLTDEEQTVARNIMNFHDAILEEAQKAGIVDEGVENYIQHIWDRTPEAARKVMAQINYAALRPNPAFAKQRKLPTYFDGEQLGFKPANKDVGFLTAAHDRAFQDAIASRAYIKSLFDGKAKDGRPLATISRASAHEVGDETSSAYLIKPHIKPAEEYADYRMIDHPALRKWRWADNTEDGKQTFVQGDALIHPEIYQRAKNNLGTSAVRTWIVSLAGHELHPGKAALAVSGELKQGILAFGGLFHQTTVGVHALEHKVVPFAPDDLDLNDPVQRGLVDHGLMVADFNAMESFGDQTAFELGHGAEDRKDHLSGGCAGVDVLRERDEIDSKGAEGLERSEQMRNASGEAIEAPDHHDIEATLPRVIHQPVQCWPGVFRTGDAGVSVGIDNLPAAALCELP